MVHPGLRAGFSAALLTFGLFAFALPAEAAPASTVVTCGQSITTSIRLANDLVDCPGDGLVIGAAHITLDLAGHSVTGVNAPGSEGIADDGHAGAAVRNGTIADFLLNGIGLRDAPGSAVSHMTIRTIGAGGEGIASAGVLVKDSPNTSVSDSTVMNDVVAFQSDGVDVLDSPHAVIARNQLTKNAWDGMFVYQSPSTSVVDNTFDGNQNQGIEVNRGSDDALLAGNHAADNVSNGLVVGAISDARIQDNRLTRNGQAGLFMFDLLNSQVSNNQAHGNGYGIDLEGGQNGSTGNTITTNNTSRNLFVGLLVENGADHNLVAGDVSNANQGSTGNGGGILLFSALDNTVRGNVTNLNISVGIGVFENNPGDSTGNVVADNVANANGFHGIYAAAAGTVDGGGNIAHHNMPPPDCIGVVCG
jgi:parallel beta-helix repeat protein